MHGHEGSHAAGKVIAAFGEFVIGGNYAVGAVVFIILTIINFVVVTEGRGPRLGSDARASRWTPCPASRWPSTPT